MSGYSPCCEGSHTRDAAAVVRVRGREVDFGVGAFLVSHVDAECRLVAPAGHQHLDAGAVVVLGVRVGFGVGVDGLEYTRGLAEGLCAHPPGPQG